MKQDTIQEKIECSLRTVDSSNYLPLTADNFLQVSRIIAHNINRMHNDAPYYYYLNELIKLIKSTDNSTLLSTWCRFLEGKFSIENNIPMNYYDEYANSRWLYNIILKTKSYDYLLAWQLECGTFYGETVNEMLNANSEELLDYLTINKYDAKLLRRAIDLGITENNYISFYDFVIFGSDYTDTEIIKCIDDIKISIIENNSVDNFIEYAHEMGEFHWNAELFFTGSAIPNEYKLGVIL